MVLAEKRKWVKEKGWKVGERMDGECQVAQNLGWEEVKVKQAKNMGDVKRQRG